MQNTGTRTQACLDSTLGSTFQQAWVSAPRRKKTIKKPKALNLRTRYVRIDTKLLKAFLLVNGCGEDIIKFDDAIKSREVDGILTAHLRNRPRYIQINTRTKREIELILEGYPPQYVETVRILVGDGTTTFQIQPTSHRWLCIPSPVQERADINRGG